MLTACIGSIDFVSVQIIDMSVQRRKMFFLRKCFLNQAIVRANSGGTPKTSCRTRPCRTCTWPFGVGYRQQERRFYGGFHRVSLEKAGCSHASPPRNSSHQLACVLTLAQAVTNKLGKSHAPRPSRRPLNRSWASPRAPYVPPGFESNSRFPPRRDKEVHALRADIRGGVRDAN